MLDRADEHALASLCDPGRMGRPLRQEETLVLAVLEDAVEMSRRYAAFRRHPPSALAGGSVS